MDRKRKGSSSVNSPQTGRRVKILKFGGACLTDKQQYQTLKLDHVKWFVDVIKKQHFERKGEKIIVIHGAGSFGHMEASKYGISKGLISSDGNKECGLTMEQQILGLSKTRCSVMKLHHYLIESLINHNVPVVGISPFSHICMKDVEETTIMEPSSPLPFSTSSVNEENMKMSQGLKKTKDYKPNNTCKSDSEQKEGTKDHYMSLVKRIEQLISWDCIPLLHGDVCFKEPLTSINGDIKDNKSIQSFGVLSGDVIMEILCAYFRPEQVCFVTNVPGVLTKYPIPTTDTSESLKYLIKKIGVSRNSNTLHLETYTSSRSPTLGKHEEEKEYQQDGESTLNSYNVDQKYDVTGGIKKKIESCIKIIKSGSAKEIAIVESGTKSAEQYIQDGHFIKGRDIGTIIFEIS